MRILFIGNSYTYFNDMPKILERVAHSAGIEIFTDKITKPGGCLNHLLEDASTENQQLEEKLQEKWDYVILQEQSQLPALKVRREVEMFPAVRILKSKFDSIGAETIMFMTWGHKYGDSDNGLEGFKNMQQALKEGYEKIAGELGVRAVPVGLAWEELLEKNPEIDLWTEDNSHPTIIGSYVAACVFFKAFFSETLFSKKEPELYHPVEVEEAVAIYVQDQVFKD